VSLAGTSVNPPSIDDVYVARTGETWRAFDALLPEDFAAVGDDG